MPDTVLHPGQVLARGFDALGVAPTELTRHLRLPANRMTQIVQGERAISGNSALLLSRLSGNSAESWINFQVRHDLRLAAQVDGEHIRDFRTRVKRRSRRRREAARAA